MSGKTKIRSSIKKNLESIGFSAQNDPLKSYKLKLEDGWCRVSFSFGKYHDKFNFNILRRIDSIDNDWDPLWKVLNTAMPEEGFWIQTHIPSLGKHFEAYQEVITPFTKMDILFSNPDKFEEAFTKLTIEGISPFINDIGDLNLLNEVMNKPANRFEHLHDIISGGTAVLFRKVLLAYRLDYEHKLDVEDFVRDLFEEKLNVKGSRQKFTEYMGLLDETIKVAEAKT